MKEVSMAINDLILQMTDEKLTMCHLLTVLSSTLDLLDLSEPGERRNSRDRKSALLSQGDSQKNTSHRKKTDETELIQVEVEHTGPSMRTPERASLDSGRETLQSLDGFSISDTKSYLVSGMICSNTTESARPANTNVQTWSILHQPSLQLSDTPYNLNNYNSHHLVWK